MGRGVYVWVCVGGWLGVHCFTSAGVCVSGVCVSGVCVCLRVHTRVACVGSVGPGPEGSCDWSVEGVGDARGGRGHVGAWAVPRCPGSQWRVQSSRCRRGPRGAALQAQAGAEEAGAGRLAGPLGWCEQPEFVEVPRAPGLSVGVDTAVS